MTTLRQAAQAALEAMVAQEWRSDSPVMTNLRAALAEPQPDVFGMPFVQARQIILDMDAETARGMAISLLIQLSIAQKVYQEPQPEPFITYRHPTNNSCRFRQAVSAPLPEWAVDVHPEPQPEPVALQIWCDTCEGTGSVTQESQRGVVGSGGTFECPDCDGRGFNLKTVAAPQAQAQQPLTDEQIETLIGEHWEDDNSKPIYITATAFARAIERALGIGAKP